MGWRIGCSGFYYPEWKDVFYPKGLVASKWFEYYCERFNTVELNGTFYRTPKVSQLKNWFAKSPEHFLFSVKAPRLITHYKKFSDVTFDMRDFYNLLTEGFGNKLGCILFQLPPSFAFTEENLLKIIAVLDPAYNNVIEFRHASWWNAEVYRSLAEKHITFCSISHPTLPDTIVKTSNVLYFRFHGVPELYKSSYSDNTLRHVVNGIKSQHAPDNYIYFNNTMHGTAIGNIHTFESMLAQQPEAHLN